MKVPINRYIDPEVIGGGVQVAYHDTTLSAGTLSFSDNSTSNPLTMATVKNEAIYINGGVSNKLDAFVKVHKESSSLLGIKIQLYGVPTKEASSGHSLAVTIAGGSERDSFKDSFTIDLKSDISDYSLIHGYRFDESLMMYEGVSISNYTFEGKITGASGLDSDRIDYAARNILGGHIGVVYGSHGLQGKLELASQKIEWSNTPSKTYLGIGFAVVAGW